MLFALSNHFDYAKTLIILSPFSSYIFLVLLCIDSSRKTLSIALYDEARAVFILEKTYHEKSSALIALLKQSFDEHEIELKSLSKIICSIGPGSFTGIRTGLSIAKTLAAQLNLEIFAVNNFELLRFEAQDFTKAICMLAGKNDYYISLDRDYKNPQTNFFSFEKQDLVISEFARDNTASLLLQYFLSEDAIDMKSQDSVEPYYLREPSIGKKANSKV